MAEISHSVLRTGTELLAWIERAHAAEAKASALLADMAAAASAVVEGRTGRARDILMSGFVNAARIDMSALIDVAAERRRQVDVEGWTPEKDDDHTPGELALAGAAWALAAAEEGGESAFGISPEDAWPFEGGFRTEGKDARRRMVIAAALLLAAVEANDRAMIRSHAASAEI